ncbi:hypothetical protein KP509_25G023900 [Ceratopteris richardii]|uniref:Polyribonucleotide nucleotidyltransferase 2, mitochondrial n=1 Tax=Ceratopteris richardii TaxID=49495 RepID=A0A8T2RR34_CERRI|nr:hypothetical protein KP509_25G023900 [Ceratopteris richardii]
MLQAKGEVFEEKAEVGSHTITFETGKLARFASGAVVVGVKNTHVLTTVVGATKLEEGKGFMPLQVDYREKQYAQGRIPNTFMRREGAPKERELLVGRIIDRSIRNLFPKGYYYESQVMSNVLCVDGEQDPDVLAACAASAALMVSDIPWNGPVGVVRIGRVEGKFVVNPDMDELALSDLNLVYAGSLEKTIMMETQAREISNNDFKLALKLAHAEAVKLIPPQIRLASKVQNQKRSFYPFTVDSDVLEKIRAKAEIAIDTVMGNPSYGKFERGKALANIQNDIEAILKEEGEEKCLKFLPVAFDQVRKEVVIKNIFEKGQRVDGRGLDEVRDLHTEINLFAPLHGSSLFSRGNTQVLCTVTLGAPEDAQKLDSLVGAPKKSFMLHYSFPPYCINEVGKSFGLNRREVGHGTLAEKALVALLPPENDFPYSVRVTSEVMASDGSSSMATVCGGSLALMDAGVPLRSHVAGVSVGLVSKVDEETGKITDYKILTDILGLEDHVGDMDFKIAGTRVGITAIQLDIKPSGIPLDILCEALEPARIGREHILDAMERTIEKPNTEEKENAPHRGYISVERDYLGKLIGPAGSTVKNIERTTGVRISISAEGRVCVLAKDKASYVQAMEMVDSILGKEIEVGNIYTGCVTAIKDYGAFVETEGGSSGLVHISELSHHKVASVRDAVMIGQKLNVMCIGRDAKGNLKFSLKAAMPSTSSVQVKCGESASTAEVGSVTANAARSVAEWGNAAPGAAKTTIGSFPVETITKSERDVLVYKFPEKRKNTSGASNKANDVVGERQEHNGSQKLHDVECERTSKPGSVSQTKGIRAEAEYELERSLRPTSVSQPKGVTTEAENELKPGNVMSNKTIEPQVVIDVEYEAIVYKVKALGAILKLRNGELGKLFFDEGITSSTFQCGDQVLVKCTKIDQTGRPVFILVDSSKQMQT